jgi:AraC-like DNA-binding protein
MGCTGNGTSNDVKAKAAWHQYSEAHKAKDLKRILAIIDSMETENIIGTPKADHLRGLAYDQGWQMQIAEHFYKKSYEGYASDPSQDWHTYTDAGYRWACLRFSRGDTEGALGVISKLMHQAEGNEAFPKRIESALLMLMANVQLQLHQFDEAKLTGQKVYEAVQQFNDNEHREGWNMAWACMNISDIHHKTGDIEEALEWIDRCAQGLALAEQEHHDSLMIEEWKGHVALLRALYQQESGHAAEAAATYAAIPHSRLMEPRSYTEAADYLMAAGRYNEAAYWYEQIDSTYLATDGAKMTFDIIATRLSPRYTAYRKAGRNADAMVIGDSISAAIDSALVWQKKNDAAELAVIYQTHEKELALNNAKAETRIHRILLVSAILLILLISYLLWRTYKNNQLLTAKNRKLYDEIEQRRKEEQQEMVQLQAAPEEQLTAEQQLYRRLCLLMDEQQPYTDETLNRNALARLLGTNAKYVEQAIRQCSKGETVSDFINRYRLEHVARLLKTTDDPIAIIGVLSGIPSRTTLIRIFRNAYGMTPSEYRKI